MSIEIKVPALGESVSEASIAKLHVKAGDSVKADQLILELETDKVTLEVNAPSAGSISELKVNTVTEKGSNPKIILESSDKQLLGAVAAKIRSLRKPEPYKGKGVKYKDEYIRRKAGKSAGK